MAHTAPRQRQAGVSRVATARYQNPGFDPDEEIRIVLIGKTGNGKSESGNTILQRHAFRAVLSPCSVTSECKKARGVVNGFRVAVIDTPGIRETKYKEVEVIRKLKEYISLSAPGPHAFLIVIKLDRFTEEEQNTVELLRLVFGDKASDYFLVLFTHGDQLGRTTVEEYFSKCDKLSHLIAQCNWRYHVFNNTVSDNRQVRQLLAKIRSMISVNGGTFYTNAMFQEAEIAIKDPGKTIMKGNTEQKRRQDGKLRARFKGEELQVKLQCLDEEYERESREKAEEKNKFLETGFDPDEEIRIVLIGKTGNGKSESGNTILQRHAFRAVLSPCSETSECEKVRGVVNGFRVAVIDTPGIRETKYKEVEVIRKLKECISLSAPGPHAFLIVIKLDRFTEEEQNTVELLRLVFGDKASDYFLVLFTHGDQLGRTTIEEYFSKCAKLSHLIAQCNWRYHVFNNTVSDNRQVRQLLAKIRSMISVNGGTFYTNAMFQEAERAIQDQAKTNLKASTEQKRREEEKLRARFKGEELQVNLQCLDEEYERKSREKAEKKNKFLETGMILPSVEAGIAIGIGAAAAGGPLCIAVGAVVGGAVGAVVGILTPAAVKALKRRCSVQ